MYVQFLIEDKSTEKLVCHVMEKLKTSYPEKSITYDTKAFGGIGHLPKTGTPIERKTGQLLNDLPMYLRAFNKKFCNFQVLSLSLCWTMTQEIRSNFKNNWKILQYRI